MIAHEAESVDMMPEPLDPLLEQEVEASSISVIEEDGLPCVAAQGDMVECPWIMDSWLAGHATMLNNKLQYCKPDPIPWRSSLIQDLEEIYPLWVVQQSI